MYLGNETDQEMSLSAMELCGFNTGSYQQKAITGVACFTVMFSLSRFVAVTVIEVCIFSWRLFLKPAAIYKLWRPG